MKHFRWFYFLFCFLIFSVSHAQEQKPDSAQKDSLSFLPKEAIVYKTEGDRVICFLSKNTEIQGILCRGHAHDWQTVFYKNGKLKLAWLARDQEIQGFPCQKASFWTEIFGGSAGVHFHENGKLKKFKLAKDMIIQGHRFKKGDIVRLDPKGKLVLEIEKK